MKTLMMNGIQVEEEESLDDAIETAQNRKSQRKQTLSHATPLQKKQKTSDVEGQFETSLFEKA